MLSNTFLILRNFFFTFSCILDFKRNEEAVSFTMMVFIFIFCLQLFDEKEFSNHYTRNHFPVKNFDWVILQGDRFFNFLNSF